MSDRPENPPQSASSAPPHKERLDDPIETPPAEESRPKGWAPPKRGPAATFVFAALIVVGVLLALYAWGLPPFRRSVQTTDYAYVRGQTTVIAPQLSGYVAEVLVQDFQQVRKGDPLVRIDDRIYRQRVEQGRANLLQQQANLANAQQSLRSSQASLRGQVAAVANAEAQLLRARADMRRVDELVAEGSVSLRERDQTLAALRQAEAALAQARAQRSVAEEQVRTVEVSRGGLEAAVAQARAALRLAEIDLANTVVRAPRDGRLGEVGVRLGQYVTAGSQLLFLVPPVVWIVANYKEAQTARMAPGQYATFNVDALAGAELRGHVERLAPAAGNEFQVIRPDNATGNFVKVPQRIGVRIAVDPGQPLAARLRPGMSVEAHVHTGDAGARR